MARARPPATTELAAGLRALSRTRRVRPTWRAILAFLIAGLALVLGYGLGRVEYLAVAVFAALIAGAGLLYVRLRRPRLDVQRVFFPPVIAADGVVQVDVRITNVGARASTPLSWDDALPWHEDIPTRTLPPLAPGRRGMRSSSYHLHPPRRGLYAVGPFVVEHEDPFGMATSTFVVGQPDRLVVVPAVSNLSEGGPTLADGDGEAHLVQRRVAGNDDDLTTREYRFGDALRRVHWRASARHGQLMVRQEEHRSHPDARILIDTRRRGYPDAFRDTGVSWEADWASDDFEWVVRMAASLGVHLESAGFRVAIEETARAQIESIGTRWDGHRAEGFLTSLAAVRLLDRAALDELGVAAPDGSGPIFAILADPEDVTVDWMLKRRRAGEAAYAFLVEPRTEVIERLRDAGWVCVESAWNDDPADAWRRAGAERAVSR